MSSRFAGELALCIPFFLSIEQRDGLGPNFRDIREKKWPNSRMLALSWQNISFWLGREEK